LNKAEWFKSKTDDEWTKYFLSRLPLSKDAIIDLEDYVVWRIASQAIEDGLFKEEEEP